MSKHDEIHKIWVNGTHNSLTTKLFLGPLRRASGQKVPIYLWDISFHAVVVFGLGKDFLLKSVLGRCALGAISWDFTITDIT